MYELKAQLENKKPTQQMDKTRFKKAININQKLCNVKIDKKIDNRGK